MIAFPLESLEPVAEAVYEALGLSPGARPSARSAGLLPRALESFRELAEPRGMERRLRAAEFAAVFHGQGRNAPRTPLLQIFPRASRLHLFAFTLGEKLSTEIRRLFAGEDFALAAVLDAIASQAADHAGRLAEEWAAGEEAATGRAGGAPVARLYSPGYCGWHISGQKRLFAALEPERIGMRLNESFLMTPLKSISGVLVAGPAAIHRVEPTYPFCAQCKTPTCRERKAARSA